MRGGATSRRRLISFASQPARGGSRMTVARGVMWSVTSSDFARMAVECEVSSVAILLVSSVKADLSTSTSVSLRSRAIESPIVPTPE